MSVSESKSSDWAKTDLTLEGNEVRVAFRKTPDFDSAWWQGERYGAAACHARISDLFDIPKEVGYAILVISLKKSPDAYHLRYGKVLPLIDLHYEDQWHSHYIPLGLYRLFGEASRLLSSFRCKVYVSVEYGSCA